MIVENHNNFILFQMYTTFESKFQDGKGTLIGVKWKRFSNLGKQLPRTSQKTWIKFDLNDH